MGAPTFTLRRCRRSGQATSSLNGKAAHDGVLTATGNARADGDHSEHAEIEGNADEQVRKKAGNEISNDLPSSLV